MACAGTLRQAVRWSLCRRLLTEIWDPLVAVIHLALASSSAAGVRESVTLTCMDYCEQNDCVCGLAKVKRRYGIPSRNCAWVYSYSRSLIGECRDGESCGVYRAVCIVRLLARLGMLVR